MHQGCSALSTAERIPRNSAELFRRNGCRHLEFVSVAVIPLKFPEPLREFQNSSKVFENPSQIPKTNNGEFLILRRIPKSSAIRGLPRLPSRFFLFRGNSLRHLKPQLRPTLVCTSQGWDQREACSKVDQVEYHHQTLE